MIARRALGPNEVHVDYVLLDEAHDEALERAWAELMTVEEAARHKRFRFEDNRHEFLLTRALVRTTLSRYADVDPRAWTFGKNEHGCPHLTGPSHAPKLRFNLTNTHGLVAIIVGLARDVGVDGEWMDRRTETTGIAHRYFAPSEVAALKAQPEDAQRHRFFQYWTLKEAYIKAREKGLAIPLDQFAFRLDDGPRIGISIDARQGDDPLTWQFDQIAPTPGHLLSVAVRRSPGASRDAADDVTIRYEKVLPPVG